MLQLQLSSAVSTNCLQDECNFPPFFNKSYIRGEEWNHPATCVTLFIFWSIFVILCVSHNENATLKWIVVTQPRKNNKLSITSSVADAKRWRRGSARKEPCLNGEQRRSEQEKRIGAESQSIFRYNIYLPLGKYKLRVWETLSTSSVSSRSLPSAQE